MKFNKILFNVKLAIFGFSFIMILLSEYLSYTVPFGTHCVAYKNVFICQHARIPFTNLSFTGFGILFFVSLTLIFGILVIRDKSYDEVKS